ncbi:DUF4349 domain-containing protein [Cellulomonas composti]|uniref:DUF4349 domain-containing protein n=1 Tax=Cellulomonas composti TaxID=266130 RepID=A0A511J8Y6_9CELL|nr:DUF4349 domain-containing protein [Cellulomonas composti]GEL94450.1 hypothetical protein CCO02nite_11080 [Cellulomonas composti]
MTTLRRSTRPTSPRGLLALTGLTALVTAALLAGCSAGASSDSDVPAAGGMEQVDDAGDAATTGDEAAASATDAGDRQVIQTGSVTVTVDAPVQVADHLVDYVESAGGRVDDRSEQVDRGDGSSSVLLVVRVPAAKVTATVERLRELGDVDTIDLHAQDVTGAAADLDARISAAEVSVARLEDLMAQSGSVKDLLAAESTLAERQASLEQLQAERAQLADKVALSTIEIALVMPGVVPAAAQSPRTFTSGLEVGWQSFTAAARAVVVALGVLLPWLVFLGALTAATVGLVRRNRRRRAPQAAPEPGR